MVRTQKFGTSRLTLLLEKRKKKKRMPTKLTGDLVYPDDPRYAAASQSLIQLYPQWPRVIVFVKDPIKDVRNAIKWSIENDVTIRIRGGRCSTECWSTITNGIVCDISQLKKIQIDEKARKVYIEAGVTQGEITNFLTNTGWYTALGNEGILGLCGVLLGGGIGLLSRHKGPGCDSLVETKTVLSNGRIVKANKNKNKELFWAQRGGGGGNFGVVTSFAMRLYKAPALVVVWSAVFPLSNFFQAYDTWQRWAPYVKDTRLSSNNSVYSDRMEIHGIFLGSQQQLGNLLQPILSLPGGTFTVTEKPFNQWFVSTPSTEQPYQKYSPHWFAKPLPRKALQAIYNHMLVAPSPQSNFFSLAWGGHTRKIPKGGTAFPKSHRQAIMYAEPGAEWNDSKIIPQALSWVETLHLELQRYSIGAYVNVLDRSISEYGEQYYGKKNYAKLQGIKKKYDPKNVWHFEQSVPTCQD
jgi:hypothetical protein